MIGFVIADKPFGHGIPAQVAAELAADVAEMKDCRGAVAAFDVGDGELAGLDAVEPVVDMGDQYPTISKW